MSASSRRLAAATGLAASLVGFAPAADAQVVPPAGTPPTGAPGGAPTAGTPVAALPPLPGPPVRRIESAQALSTEPLGAVTGIRQLSDGRVLLNDGTRRRLLLLDSTLKRVGVVLDSLTEVENAYGTRAGALLPYLGDSTLFVDAATYAMLILDPQGRIARVRSVPRAQDVNSIGNLGGSNGMPGFDAKGRLVYRIQAVPAPPAVAPPAGVPWFPSPPDSAFVVAVDLDTRRLDTLGVIRTTKITMQVRQSAEGGFNINSYASPMPLVDDWAVLSDGTVAFVRGRDYRIEYLGPDGKMVSSEKLPFPWVNMTDEDKSKFMDSVKTLQTRSAQNNYVMSTIAWSNLLNKPYPKTFVAPPGFVLPPGIPKDWILPDSIRFPANYMYGCPPGVKPPAGAMPPGMVLPPGMMPPMPPAAAAPPAGAAPGGAAAAPSCMQNPYADYFGFGYTPPAPTYRAPAVFPAQELPDYKPPITAGSVRPDADGNLWIRTLPMRPTPGGPIYDIVNRKGELVDRLQLPPGYTLVGFGPGKVVYLTMRDAQGLHLARVRLK